MQEQKIGQEQEIEYYRRGIRWLHWVEAAVFIALAITGLFLYIPQLGVGAQDGYVRIIHRVAAVIFIAAPLIYFLTNMKDALVITKAIFTPEKDSIKWIKAAPDYYFGGSEEKMPAQGAMNPGQKLWAITVFLGGIGFVVTGITMWAFKGESSGLFLASVFAHDVLFIVVGSFLLVHIYLGALHPRMTESMYSMITGKISIGYAESHHGKWLLRKQERVEAANESTLAKREG